MKSIKIPLAVLVVLLNSYSFSLWIYSFYKFPTQTERVDYFLQKWFVFESFQAVNIFLILATIAAFIIINLKPEPNRYLRTGFSAVYILFLAFTLWGYL